MAESFNPIQANLNKLTFKKRENLTIKPNEKCGKIKIFVGKKPDVKQLVITNGREEIYDVDNIEIINFDIDYVNPLKGVYIKSDNISQVNRIQSGKKVIIHKDRDVNLNMFKYIYFVGTAYAFVSDKVNSFYSVIDVDDYIFLEARVDKGNMNAINLVNSVITYGNCDIEINEYFDILNYTNLIGSIYEYDNVSISGDAPFLKIILDNYVFLISVNKKHGSIIPINFMVSYNNIKNKIFANLLVIEK